MSNINIDLSLGKLVTSPHKRSKLSNFILCTFSSILSQQGISIFHMFSMKIVHLLELLGQDASGEEMKESEREFRSLKVCGMKLLL